jgi:prepilin-type N-terminal cleavage/methylation domain-containing protein
MRLAKQRGFTLIEIVVVIVVVAILIAMAAALTRGVIAGQKRSLTVTRMQAVDAALVQFVTQQRRLPCPADGTLASGDANAGVEMRVANACSPANQQAGVVPWRALGLAEVDATDGWDRRITYRIDPALGAPNAMDMSMCDPAGAEAGAGPTACTATCTSTALATCTPPAKFLNTRGLRVQNVAGTLLMDPAGTPHTGAAYVLISHGESGGGGYLGSGQLGASTSTDGNLEQTQNYASIPYGGAAFTYVDDSLNENPGALHFDDLVLRPSLLSVITKAGLGPRSH